MKTSTLSSSDMIKQEVRDEADRVAGFSCSPREYCSPVFLFFIPPGPL